MPLAGPPATRDDSGTTARDKTPVVVLRARGLARSAWACACCGNAAIRAHLKIPPGTRSVTRDGAGSEQALEPRTAPRPGEAVAADASAADPDVLRLGSLLALRDVELDLLPFLEAAVAAPRDRAEVHEHVRATLDRDEAVTLLAVEPFHRALRHLDLLRPGCGAPPRRRDRAS